MRRHKFALVSGTLARGWIQAITFTFFAVAARFLGVEDFGRFTLAMVFINIVQAYLYSGVYEFILKADQRQMLDRTLFISNMIFAVIGMSLSSLAGMLIGHATDDPTITVLAFLLAPSALLAAANASCEAVVLRERQYALYNITWVVAETVGCVVGVVLLVAGAGVGALVAYRYIQATIALLLFLSVGKASFAGTFRRAELGNILRFAGPIYFSRLAGTLSEYGADLLIGVLVNPAAAGIYRLASRIVGGATEVVLQPLRVVSWTRSSRVGKSPAKVALSLLHVTKLCATGFLPFIVVISFIADPAINAGLGPQWASAEAVVIILMAARAIGLFELMLEPLLVGLGRGSLLLQVRIASLATLFLLLFFTAALGVEYVGWARFASTSVSAAVALVVLCPIVGALRVWRTLRPGIALSLIALVVLAPFWLWSPTGPGQIAVRITAVALVCAMIAAAVLRSTGMLRRRPKPALAETDAHGLL